MLLYLGLLTFSLLTLEVQYFVLLFVASSCCPGVFDHPAELMHGHVFRDVVKNIVRVVGG
jgi:hypothetical protein